MSDIARRKNSKSDNRKNIKIAKLQLHSRHKSLSIDKQHGRLFYIVSGPLEFVLFAY